MKKTIAILLCIGSLLIMATGVLAETSEEASIIGTWNGQLRVSLLPISVSATVSFGEDGSFFISARGIQSTGTYTVDGNTIVLNPVSPVGFDQTKMKMQMDGEMLNITGSVMGVQGTLSVKR